MKIAYSPLKQNDHLEAAQGASLMKQSGYPQLLLFCCQDCSSLPRSLQQDPLVLEPIDREETAAVRLAVHGTDLLQARCGDSRHEQGQT